MGSVVFNLHVNAIVHMHYLLQAKLLKVKLLIADREYEGAIAESGFILKEDENNLEALLLRGRAYYYLADHDVAMRFVLCQMLLKSGNLIILEIMYCLCDMFRHFQKGLRLDPENSDLKKVYFGLKNLLKKSKTVSPDPFIFGEIFVCTLKIFFPFFLFLMLKSHYHVSCASCRLKIMRVRVNFVWQ